MTLFEFLSRFTDTENLSIQDQAEERVLWNLAGAIGKELVEPLAENYDEILSVAREKIRDKKE